MNFNISQRKLLTFILLTLGNFFGGCAVSIMAPFFPAEAEKKGSSATEYGMVFGIYELLSFIASPLLGKYLHKIGLRLALNLGMFGQGLGCLLFGILDNCSSHAWFISLAFLFRIIGAIGTSSYVTASFAVIAVEFPESMANTFAALETAFGAGLIAGPPLGGILFELGGYPLPFIVLGGFLFMSAFLSPFLTPPPLPLLNPTSQEPEKKSTMRSGIFQLMKIPGIALAALNVLSAGISNGFILTILEPHLRQFHLTPVQVTGVFVALMGTYAISAPAWSWVCPRVQTTNLVSLAGSLAMFLGLILTGPAPFLPFNTVLWVTVLGCCLNGLGTGALHVSSFLQLTEWSKKSGYPDDITTYGLTSGIWFSMLSLGSFIGPIIAGILYDIVGFRVGSLFCIVEHGLMIFPQIAFMFWVFKRNGNSRPRSYSSEAEPLLG